MTNKIKLFSYLYLKKDPSMIIISYKWNKNLSTFYNKYYNLKNSVNFQCFFIGRTLYYHEL